jgi:prefoldin subunit 5
MPNNEAMQELEAELDHYINRAAALDFQLKKVNARVAKLEAQWRALLAACEAILEVDDKDGLVACQSQELRDALAGIRTVIAEVKGGVA